MSGSPIYREVPTGGISYRVPEQPTGIRTDVVTFVEEELLSGRKLRGINKTNLHGRQRTILGVTTSDVEMESRPTDKSLRMSLERGRSTKRNKRISLFRDEKVRGQDDTQRFKCLVSKNTKIY